MQLQVTNIHRRSNGTVDMDVYRWKAFLLRRETTNQILRRWDTPPGRCSAQLRPS